MPNDSDSLKTSEFGSDKGADTGKQDLKEGDSDDSFEKA